MFSKNLVNYAIVSLFKSPGGCATGVCSTRYNKIHDKHVRLFDVFWVDGGCGEGCEMKKSGVTRLDRMKRGSGIKGRDDRSSGIEIRIADTLAKINPTDP